MTWTLISTVMSSMLYRLSYIPVYADIGLAPILFRTWAEYVSITSTCSRLGRIRTCDGNIERVMSYHLTTNPSNLSPVQDLHLYSLITKQLYFYYTN